MQVERMKWRSFSVAAKAGHQRLAGAHVQFGVAVALGVTGMGDDLVVERNRLAPRRDDGVALENHPQLAGSVAIVGLTAH